MGFPGNKNNEGPVRNYRRRSAQIILALRSSSVIETSQPAWLIEFELEWMVSDLCWPQIILCGRSIRRDHACIVLPPFLNISRDFNKWLHTEQNEWIYTLKYVYIHPYVVVHLKSLKRQIFRNGGSVLHGAWEISETVICLCSQLTLRCRKLWIVRAWLIWKLDLVAMDLLMHFPASWGAQK